MEWELQGHVNAFSCLPLSSGLAEDGVGTRIVKDSDMTTRHRPGTAKLELLNYFLTT